MLKPLLFDRKGASFTKYGIADPLSSLLCAPPRPDRLLDAHIASARLDVSSLGAGLCCIDARGIVEQAPRLFPWLTDPSAVIMVDSFYQPGDQKTISLQCQWRDGLDSRPRGARGSAFHAACRAQRVFQLVHAAAATTIRKIGSCLRDCQFASGKSPRYPRVSASMLF